jgi:hypothetical protein
MTNVEEENECKEASKSRIEIVGRFFDLVHHVYLERDDELPL